MTPVVNLMHGQGEIRSATDASLQPITSSSQQCITIYNSPTTYRNISPTYVLPNQPVSEAVLLCPIFRTKQLLVF